MVEPLNQGFRALENFGTAKVGNQRTVELESQTNKRTREPDKPHQGTREPNHGTKQVEKQGNQRTAEFQTQGTREQENCRTTEPRNQRTVEPQNQRTREPESSGTIELGTRKTLELKNQRTIQQRTRGTRENCRITDPGNHGTRKQQN